MASLGRTDRRVAVLGLARMSESFGNAVLLVVLPLYVVNGGISGVTFGLPEAVIIGVLLSLTHLLASLGQPALGYVSDRLQRRLAFIVAGLATLATTNLLYVVAATYLALFGIRLLQGVGTMFTVPTTIALINEYAPEGARGENMGIYTTLRLVGTGIGPVVGGAVVEFGPYRPLGIALSGFDASFLVAAVGAATSALLVARFVPEVAGSDRPAERPTFGMAGVDRLTDPVYHVSVGALVFGINLGLVLAIQPQVNARLGQGATMFGLQLVAFGVPLVLLGPLFGALSDRYGRRVFLLGGLAVLVPATFAQGVVTTSGGMILARLAAGVAAALAFAPAVALIGDVATTRDAGSKLSMLTMSLGIGSGVSPLVSGFLVGFGYVVPFAFGTVLAALVFAAGVVVLPETIEYDAEDAHPWN